MLSYKRSARVGELIQQTLSKIVQEIKEPGIGFITITGIKLSDDLQSARVFYSVIGGEEEKAKAGAVLKDSIPSMRHELAHTLNLRRTPTLAFQYDETPERASRIFTILEKIHAEEVAPPPSPEGAPKAPRKKKTEKRKG